MITWILALLLIGGFGWSGRRLGAVQLAVMLLGVMVAAILGTKLGPVLQPFIVEAAKGNPLVIWVVPHLAVFLLVYICFLALAALVHFKVMMYYKYKVPDDWRVLWERMNAAVGIALGVVTGVAHFIVYGMIVYSLGYWTIQLESSGTNPRLVRMLNPARQSLHSSGFEKLIAAFDPASDNFYHAADVAGLLYGNPSVMRRFTSYPGTLGLVERPEFLTLLTSAPAPSSPGAPPPPVAPPPGGGAPQGKQAPGLAAQPNIMLVLTNSNVQALLKNKEVVAQLSKMDMKDLVDYLKTGQSPKYKDDKLLGRWDLYIPATLIQMKQRHPEVPIAVLGRLKKLMQGALADVTLIAMPESRIIVKGSLANSALLTEMLSAKIPTAPLKPSGMKVLAEATWKKEGKDYVVVFKRDKGEQPEGLSVLANDNLVTSFFGEAMVFTRSE